MLLIRCTGKLRKVGGWKVDEPDEGSVGPARVWYANLLWVDRRKCILFTHGMTLFSVFVPDVRKSDLADLQLMLEEAVYHQLIFDGIDLNDAEPVLGIQDEHVVVGVARDRRILGSMTDQAFQYEYHIGANGGLPHVHPRLLARSINEAPMSLLQLNNPHSAMIELVGAGKPRLL